jgi:hypothetical protein
VANAVLLGSVLGLVNQTIATVNQTIAAVNETVRVHGQQDPQRAERCVLSRALTILPRVTAWDRALMGQPTGRPTHCFLWHKGHSYSTVLSHSTVVSRLCVCGAPKLILAVSHHERIEPPVMASATEPDLCSPRSAFVIRFLFGRYMCLRGGQQACTRVRVCGRPCWVRQGATRLAPGD